MAVRARPQSPPTWQRLSECPRCVAYRPHLRRTILTALAVGTILFVINHLDTVLNGQATTGTWVKTGLTYLVPFCVANIGILIACRRTTRRHRPCQPGRHNQDQQPDD